MKLVTDSFKKAFESIKSKNILKQTASISGWELQNAPFMIENVGHKMRLGFVDKLPDFINIKIQDDPFATGKLIEMKVIVFKPEEFKTFIENLESAILEEYGHKKMINPNGFATLIRGEWND